MSWSPRAATVSEFGLGDFGGGVGETACDPGTGRPNPTLCFDQVPHLDCVTQIS